MEMRNCVSPPLVLVDTVLLHHLCSMKGELLVVTPSEKIVAFSGNEEWVPGAFDDDKTMAMERKKVGRGDISFAVVVRQMSRDD